LRIKVVPGASRDEIAGWLGGALKVRVTAPPERGRANAAVEGLLAASLGLPAECVRVVAGLSSARKTVAIERLSATQVGERLGKP